MAVEVRGADRFRVVARRLRTAADRKDLTRELRKGILDAVPELKDAVKSEAHAYLPDRYAGELVPSLRMTTSSTLTGDQVTVRISVTAKGKGGHARQVGALEDGDLRHPVFGRTRALKRHAVHKATSRVNPWVNQNVRAGWVSKPMLARQPAVRKQIEAAVDRVLDKITGA
ncbi:hypothetical protein [Micromonospora sp. RTP1Z1]|uniref:hypothetical protein n=1 Tax=Micromonospora sp. RTP1Z1 TaxID=2994043 RepID=UPI0029C804AD|nr:hypothetical protein [Micromonospora sp. RTP1Z1]